MILINWKATISKVIIYILLLISFFVFYMMDVLNEYASKKTNFAKTSWKIPEEGVNVPALTFCSMPPFKPSMLKLHNISHMFCIDANLVDETNEYILKNANMTWNEFCLNISYQLNRDFAIEFANLNAGIEWKKGINKIGGSEVEIKEIFTKYDGLCYAMHSNLLFNKKTNTGYMMRITNLVGFELIVLPYFP